MVRMPQPAIGIPWTPTILVGSAAPGFFADGNTAIVLQNNDGSVALWDMSGTTILAAGLVP